ncbi:MAG: heavy-metal-associated domain-containing protein [Deltaproteobacteria bacterium]|nr:heavy-metal-associated domain-containing protein [Deltaproteobacteria bacterium]
MAQLKQTPGVIAYDVDWKSDKATILYDPAKVSIEELKKAIARAGFQARAVEELSK